MNKNGVVGRGELLKLFPDFKEDVAENGIDLRIGSIKQLKSRQENVIGCVDDEKLVPEYEETNPTFIHGKKAYIIQPNHWYFITVDRPIHIPDGYTQLYLLRSTFVRCGLILGSAVGDNDFNGTLMMSIYNASKHPVYVGANERIIQAVTFYNDGTASCYDGSYQNDKIYEEKE